MMKWRPRAACAFVGVLVALAVGWLPLPSVCVVAGYRDRTEHVEGRVFVTAHTDSRTDIAALGALLDAENGSCDGDCETFDVLWANCGTKKPQELEARMGMIRDDMAFRTWINQQEGSPEYESMNAELKTGLALRFLASQLDDEEDKAKGPILVIREVAE